MKWIFLVLLAWVGSALHAQELNRLSNQELQALLKNPEVQLVDVRYARELSSGGIEGARHINLYDPNFETKVKQLDKNKPVALYCASGIRSARAGAKLLKLGFEQVYDLRRGVKGWKAEGNAMTPVKE